VTHGLLLIDKPEGLTSNGVVGIVRRCLGRSVKVGHTGTLDPAATGLLVILVGAATRALNFLDEAQKHYQVEIRLGEESDTCDREGKITVTGDPGILTPDDIELCLKGFIGKSDQIPPHFSAIKKDGIPLYKLARRGIFPALEIRKIEVFELSILDWCPPNLKIDLICSKGAYARSLARDIGARLGVGGRVDTLRRIGSGKFNIETAHDLEFIRNAPIQDIQRSLIPLRQALEHIPEIKVSSAGLRKLAFGVYLESGTGEIISELELDCKANIIYRVQDANDRIMILVRSEQSDIGPVVFRPIRVFNLLSNTFLEDGWE
jgi:tRNA pseudouridine55 synthase